jgi:hydrogenase-1 operon protein HyaF
MKTRLGAIPVHIDHCPPTTQAYANALPILSEIRHAVARLAETGEPTCIDLAALPFGPGDEDQLMELLGRGEVHACIDALGPTRIWETRFPGVWVLDYANAEDQRIALQVEVDEVPRILRAQRPDLQESLAALDARIKAAASSASSEPDSRANADTSTDTDADTDTDTDTDTDADADIDTGFETGVATPEP